MTETGRPTRLRTTLLRNLRLACTFGALVYALPVTCSQEGGSEGMYPPGFQPSPAGNVNPMMPQAPNSPEGR
jgi:hypothetical protein